MNLLVRQGGPPIPPASGMGIPKKPTMNVRKRDVRNVIDGAAALLEIQRVSSRKAGGLRKSPRGGHRNIKPFDIMLSLLRNT
ncbi:MAG: hypothetical protein SWQ30_05655 [Thermodesulfobacteriota bacterium]|nr:hypothetical protein [Thermodesulfobacteriota bacterium]